MTTADLSGDGFDDIIVADQEGGIDVLPNQGDGSFGPAISYAAGPVPDAVTTADLTGDGGSDIIVADAGGGVDILLNQGAGSFAAVSYASSISPTSVTTADLTGDGLNDIILAGYYGLDVLTNLGNGSFATVSYSVNPFEFAVTTADLTGDGRSDIIVAGYFGVDVMTNQGGGSFTTVSYYAGDFPSAVATADLTGDGRSDIVVADEYGGVTILLNEGNGSFATVSYAAGSTTTGVTTADLTGDGRPDIILSDADGNIEVLLNEGNGSFAPAVTYAAGASLSSVAAADLSEDGHTDIIAGDFYGGVDVLQNVSETTGAVSESQSLELATVAPGVAGDTLILSASTVTGGGIVSLQDVNGTEEVIYTAPDSVAIDRNVSVSYTIADPANGTAAQGAASLELLAAPPVVLPVSPAPAPVEQGETIELATVTVAVAGDALSLTQTGDSAGGTVSLQDVAGTEEVIYTAPAVIADSGTDEVSYTIAEQNRGTLSTTQSVALDAGPQLNDLADTLSLGLAVSVPTGATPTALTAADLTGNGLADLILAVSGGVEVLCNEGQGTFAAPVSYAAGTSPTAVTTADLSFTGLPDIIVADGNGGVDVLLNQGSGSFAPAVSYSLGIVPASVTTADLTGDGLADLIVAGYGGVEVLLNQGGGTFGPATSYDVGIYPSAVTTADLTGDGLADIIVADEDGGVEVMMNQGGGSFAAPVSYLAGSYPAAVTTADLTGDGRADIITADKFGGVEILMNEGNGRFAAPVTYLAGSGVAYAVTTADLTGNGLADIIVTDESGDIEVLLNQGNGSFAPAVDERTGAQASQVTTADLAGDGQPDIIALDGNGQVEIFPNQSVSGTLTPSESIELATVSPGAPGDTLGLSASSGPAGGTLALQDVNGIEEVIYTAPAAAILADSDITVSYTIVDQHDDATAQGSALLELQPPPPLLTAVPATGALEQGQTMIVATVAAATAGDTLVLAQTGGRYGGTLSLQDVNGTETVIYTAPASIAASVTSDIDYTITEYNEDGERAGVVSGAAAVALDAGPQLSERNTSLSLAVTLSYVTNSYDYAVATADLTGQGLPDLVIAAFQAGQIDVLLNQGQGSYAAAVSYDAGYDPVAMTTADLSGDGRSDIIIADEFAGAGSDGLVGGYVEILQNQGQGGFAALTYLAGTHPFALTTADLNGDGRQDIIALDEIDQSIDVLTNQGDGRFTAALYDAGSSPVAVTTADLTGNGLSDIIVADQSGGVEVLMNDGHGGFAGEASYGAGLYPTALTTADLTGDGLPDVIVADAGGDGVDVLLNEGNGSFSPAVSYAIGASPVSLTTADLTGNGQQDIIVAGSGIEVLLNLGNGSFAPAVTYDAGVATSSVTTADLTGDGLPDIISTFGNGSVAVLINQGNGTFLPSTSIAAAYPFYVATADLLGNGQTDLIAAGYNGVEVIANQTATRTTLTVQQSVELATVSPGVAGDTLSLVAGTDPAGGNLSLQNVNGTEAVFYTAPAAITADSTDSLSYTVVDQHDDTIAQGSAILQLQVPAYAEDVGALVGATVGYDNGNGAIDPTQPTATTGASGQFALTGGNGALILTGGTDSATGLAFTGTLEAPAGSLILSPLTTLVAAVATSTATAVAEVDQALGLPAGTQLTTLDAAGGTKAGNPAATAALIAGAELQDMTSLIAAAGGSAGAAVNAVAALVMAGGAVDLTDPITIEDVATASGLDSAAAGAVASMLEATESALANQLSTAGTPLEVFNDVTGASIALQGEQTGQGAGIIATAAQLAAVNGDSAYGAASSDYTANLATTLAAADLTAADNDSACYCVGAQIATDRGEVAIEALKIGDAVLTLSGESRAIVWIGRRSYAPRFARRTPCVWPVRIRAGALGEGLPARDLCVSPRHAMYLDGFLVRAHALVNGVSIVQEEATGQVDYIHVELATHDIIFAEGAASESFVDDDSRALFNNAEEFHRLYPHAAPRAASYCAPLLTDGFALAVIRQRIALRAGSGMVQPAALRGYVDSVGPGEIRGWAQDPLHPEVPVCLDVVVDRVTVAQGLANRPRADLASAGIGSGRHAFSIRLPLSLTAEQLRHAKVQRSCDQAVLDHADTALHAA